MAVLTFDEAAHKYYIDGAEVPSVTQACALLTAEKYGAGQAVVKQAGRRGTAVHEICELIDYGAEPDEIEPELVGYVKAYMDFLRDYRPKWERIEWQVSHPLLGFAGTLDRYGIVEGKYTIVDIKTTASMDRAAKIALACQLAGYGMAEDVPPHIDQSFGVQLKRDGKYVVHEQAKIEDRYKFNSSAMFLDLLRIRRVLGGY